MSAEVISLDSNVIIAALDPGDVHHRQAVAFLDEKSVYPLLLPAACYAELLAGPEPELVKEFLALFRVHPVFSILENAAVWELAAERYRLYAGNRKRSRAGAPRRILTDFLVGAQALLQPGAGYRPALASFDGGFYEKYFGELVLYDPAAR